MYKLYLFVLFNHCDPYSFKLKGQKFRTLKGIKGSLQWSQIPGGHMVKEIHTRLLAPHLSLHLEGSCGV